MKIAWFGHVTGVRGNGIATYSRQLISGLMKRKCEVVFFYHASRERKLIHPDVTGIRIGAFGVENLAVISSNSAPRIIQNTLHHELPDIAHVSLSFSHLDISLPDICHEMGIPVVATVHFPYGPPAKFWGSGSRVLYRVYSGLLKKYDAVIIFSKKQQEMLIDYGVSPNRVRIIPNGIDVNTYVPGVSDYKKTIGASFLAIYVGRVDSEKNVSDFLEAFRKLDLPRDHKAVIVGGGTELSRLRRKFGQNSNIVFTGYIGDLQERISILSAADVFVLPSAIEGLSLALLEAMATGNAIIATDVGADAEALHSAGIVIDLDALEEQLPLALRTLIEYPDFRRDLAARARRRVVEQYSLETNIDRVVELYRELTGKS